jgi:hypothetical protein
MRARAEAELELVRDLRSLAKRGEITTGLQWLLERRYPAEYGQRYKFEAAVEGLTDDELEQERAVLRSRALGPAGSGSGETPVSEPIDAEFRSDALPG